MEYLINYENNYLAHHGIKGQKWGVRRYQNEDGTLTAAGMKRQVILQQKEEQKAKAARKNGN